MKPTKKNKLTPWIVGTLLVAAFTLGGNVSAAVLIDDDFSAQNASVWTQTGTTGSDVTYDNPGLNLRSATTGNSAGLISNSSFDGSTEALTLDVVLGAGSGTNDNARVGFASDPNWGGSGAAPTIWFRDDQGGNDWYIQIDNGVLVDTGISTQTDQLLEVDWAPTGIQFKISDGDTDTWTYVSSLYSTVSGPQDVQLGLAGNSPENFQINSAELQSASLAVPEPSVAALMALSCGVGCLFWLLRRMGYRSASV